LFKLRDLARLSHEKKNGVTTISHKKERSSYLKSEIIKNGLKNKSKTSPPDKVDRKDEQRSENSIAGDSRPWRGERELEYLKQRGEKYSLTEKLGGKAEFFKL